MLGDITPTLAACHQIAHLLIGFIALPDGQLNALANSGKFITDALVLRQTERKNILNSQYGGNYLKVR